MRILCTNDDGYLATGLGVLASAARTLGDVTIVAPDREQSATSHSLTIHHPLRSRRAADGGLVVDGTPTDCVILAVGELLPQRPDVVLSGINHGPNMGEDVLYSGTVAAAMEATVLGIPAVALSYTGEQPESLPAWEDLVARLLTNLLGRDDFPPNTLLSINLPPIEPADVRGVRVTSLGRRRYQDSLTRAKDPSGREYFWIGGGVSEWEGPEDSDFRAVREGYVSVTPLHLDLTNYGLLEEIRGWGWETLTPLGTGDFDPVEDPRFIGYRRRLIEDIRASGIEDLELLRLFDQVPRHLFVPEGVWNRAYEDAPLPIGYGQTASQPSLQAYYMSVLAPGPDDRVLEIGTGSGYLTALLALVAERVYSVERVRELSVRARDALDTLRLQNVALMVGDGTIGWRKYAPYQVIVVSAGAPSVPSALVDQLADPGRMLIPVGGRDEQKLLLVKKESGQISEEVLEGECTFVPLLGRFAWTEGS